MASIKYKTSEGYTSIPMNIIGSRIYLEDYDDGEVIPELVDDNAKLGNGIGTCSTSTGTALEVTLANYKLVKNGIVAVTFEYDVPANATLNINNKGAKPIYNEGSAIEADVIKAGKTVMFAYDGTNYVVTSLGGSGATQEFAVISLKTDNNTNSALTGATIIITNDNTSETILSTTWNGTDVIVGIDGGVEYTVTVGNITDYNISNTQSYTAIAGLSRQISFVYYYRTYVDFGLSSGLKWATCNVGAVNPWDDGLYFSWGNINGYTYEDGYNFSWEVYRATSGGSLTNNIPSGSNAYDAARAILGSSWRIPSDSEVQELIDNTDKEWVTDYLGTGKNGIKVMKKSDHSIFIFIPASGYINGTGRYNYNSSGSYWTTRYNNSNAVYGWEIRSSGLSISGSFGPQGGCPMRAVM